MSQSKSLSRKRSDSALSYAKAVGQGDSPAAYSPEYENTLRAAGMFMHHVPSVIKLADSSKEFCATLCAAQYDPPQHSLFQGDLLWELLERAANKNEPRVERDITPELIPSPEHLHIRGVANGLEHVTEELRAIWTRCMVLAGPSPTPDVAIGLRSSAFTSAEVQKLHSYNAPERPTAVRANLYFPFLLCEVKCAENGLSIADRQNMHSASIAVNAIFQLYRAVSRQKELDRRILVFSVSHDHTSVRVYGHFAIVHGDNDKPSFYRSLVRRVNLTEQEGACRWATYNIVRKVYEAFVPEHLDRIHSAVAQLPEPVAESAPSVATSEALSVDAQRETIPTSAPSSNDSAFKKPRLTQTGFLKEELNRRSQELEKANERTEQLRKEMEEKANQQVERVRKEMEEKAELQRQDWMNAMERQEQPFMDMFKSSAPDRTIGDGGGGMA